MNEFYHTLTEEKKSDNAKQDHWRNLMYVWDRVLLNHIYIQGML